MKNEIKNHIDVDAANKNEFNAEFCFPASFSGFDGHFPQQPVLPGVCLIQAVLCAAEAAAKTAFALSEIVLAKFASVVLPNETLVARCRIDDDMVRAKIFRDDKRVAEIRLRVQHG